MLRKKKTKGQNACGFLKFSLQIEHSRSGKELSKRGAWYLDLHLIASFRKGVLFFKLSYSYQGTTISGRSFDFFKDVVLNTNLLMSFK